jgi:chloramphenicol-sensitive protein RarD
LALSGVITAIPLLLFASGARSIPLYLMGVLQYIAPTLQLLIGIFIYHESFSPHQFIGFGMIWLALGIYTIEAFISSRRYPVEK